MAELPKAVIDAPTWETPLLADTVDSFSNWIDVTWSQQPLLQRSLPSWSPFFAVWHISHLTSATTNSEDNGLAVGAVQTAKKHGIFKSPQHTKTRPKIKFPAKSQSKSLTSSAHNSSNMTLWIMSGYSISLLRTVKNQHPRQPLQKAAGDADKGYGKPTHVIGHGFTSSSYIRHPSGKQFRRTREHLLGTWPHTETASPQTSNQLMFFFDSKKILTKSNIVQY